MSYNYVVYNRSIIPKSECQFPFDNVGFLYGYGLFETIRVYKKHPVLLDLHVQRMKDHAIILDIPFDYLFDEIAKLSADLIARNGAEDAVMHIYLTPGDRQFNCGDMKFSNPLLMMVLREFDFSQSEKRRHISLREESFRRVKMDRFKTLNYLN